MPKTISKLQKKIIKFRSYKKVRDLYDLYGMDGLRLLEDVIKDFRYNLVQERMKKNG